MKGSPKSEASLEQSIDFEYGEYESSLDQQQPSSNLIGSSSPSSSLSLSTSTTVASTSTGTSSSTSISKTTCNTVKESINSHSVPRPSPSECSPLDKGLSSLTSSLSCSGLTSTLTSTLSTTITTSCPTSTTATILKSSSTPTPTSTPTTGHDDFFNCNNKTSAVNCGGCGQTIVDRYYLVFDDRHWHSRCLTCAECGCNLERRCFVRNGLTYCKHDYHRLFGSFRFCCGCCQIIEPNQLVMKVNSQNFYHLDCFTCSQCNSVLHKNDYYVLIDGKIYCSDHYSSLVRESNVTSSLSSNNRGPSSLSSASPASSLSSPSSISYHQHHHHQQQQAQHHHQQHHLASHQHHHHQQQPQPLHLLQQNNLTSDNSISNNHVNLTNGDIKSEQMFNSSNANNGAVEATQVRQTTRGRPRRKLKKEPIECNNEHSIENRPSHPLPTSSSSSASSHPDNVFHDHLHGLGCPVDSLSDNLLDSRGLTKNSCSLPGLNGRSPMNLNSNHHHGSSSNGTSNSHSSQNGSSNNGNSKSKRVRTSFKHAQLKTMKSYFAVNQNPDAKDLKGLSTKTGLSKRVLQVWFQNARAKWRKNNPKHGDCSSTSGNSTQTKGNSLTLGTGCDTNSQQSQLNSLNGLNSSIAPATPSTGIGSPGGSSHSRPFSTPSPSSGLTIHESSSLLLTNSNGSSLDQFPPLTGPSPTRPESPNQSLQQQQQQSSSSSSSSEPLGLSLPPTGVGPTSVSSCSSPSISHHQPQHVQQHSLGPSQSPLSIPIGSHLTGVVTPHQPPSLLTSSGLNALHPATSHHSALHPPLSLPIHHHSIHLHRHPEGSSMYSPFEETLLPHSTSFQPLY